ncbi:MAG: protein disulfide oxidoreductase [Mycobacterium sp.]|uniref:protein disulfide oxidoreductase n=1 Tax=Mycobacterium sp. TaxID=1785 RepID=UPI00262FDCDA|nr:protein disulfide oxidoreductase [Mycobacterium sp.]MDI3313143.1 protein disulfide oxidoreductase [Mycobacterium sp.]
MTILGACGPAPHPGTHSAAGSAPQLAAGKAVPAQLQFTAKTVEGQEFSGASLLGKPAVLWFWAPWCSTCQSEAPMLGRVAQAHPTVTFVGVASASQLPAMQEFVKKYPLKFVQLADTSGAVWAKFGVTEQPAFAFLNRDGRIDVVKGPMNEAELTQRLTALTGT